MNMTQTQPLICVACGTPALRTAADNFSTPMLMQFNHDVADAIHAADALKRVISSGASVPRPSAFHLMHSYHSPTRDWTPDTPAQFKYMVQLVNAPFALVNVHFYNQSAVRWNLTDPIGTGVLTAVLEATRSANQQLYVLSRHPSVSVLPVLRPRVPVRLHLCLAALPCFADFAMH